MARAADRALPHGRSPKAGDIATALVMKAQDIFCLTTPAGSIPLRGRHGFGLYLHDTRFLCGYELRLAGRQPQALGTNTARGFMTTLELSNPDLRVGQHVIDKQTIGIKWERLLDARASALCEQLTFTNFGASTLVLPVEFAFRAAFESVFAVRGMRPRRRGSAHRPRWHGGELRLAYDGADGCRRELAIRFTRRVVTDGATAHIRLRLPPERPIRTGVQIRIRETDATSPAARRVRPTDVSRLERALIRRAEHRRAQRTSIHSDDARLDRVLDRSLRDLWVLASRLDGRAFYAAGVPWYVALFGRDSVISALETLAYDSRVAATTLRLLAARQGRRTDEWRDEEPGKILHELRVGEMARLNEIPQTPYFGSIDVTPLFLVLLARHTAWTGDLGLFEALRPNVEAALGWIDRTMAAHGGYLAYETRSTRGLANQGWKDSGDAIVNRDGSLARPPIALAEVQGYVYRAKHALADLYSRAGDATRADALRREADDLRTRFNRDFWLRELGVFALALQKDGQPAAVVSSNAGQALWSGIADDTRARRTADRLMRSDMFSGWGIRTLGTNEARYNPIGYHLGTVWPHDNALIAAGFRRYGCDAAACRIFTGILDAASSFPHDRLPEVFAGFDRDEYGVVVHYPVACHPQAWAAGALPYLVETMLGFSPDACGRRLRIARPVLPSCVAQIDVRGLRIGDARIDLRFARREDSVDVQVLDTHGTVDVEVESAHATS